MLCEQIEAFLLFISLNFSKILESGCKPRESAGSNHVRCPPASAEQPGGARQRRASRQPISLPPGCSGNPSCTLARPCSPDVMEDVTASAMAAWSRGRVAPPAGRGGAARAALPSKAEHDKPLRNAALFSPATRRFDNTTGCCWSVPAGNGVNRAVLVRAGLCARHGILVHFKRRVRPGDHGTPNLRCWQRCPPKPRFPKFFPSCPPLLFARS